jgi:hypothetical protein
MRRMLLLFMAIASLTSCTITKRHYDPGYHVDWKLFRDNTLEVPLPGSQIAKVHWPEISESIHCDFFFHEDRNSLDEVYRSSSCEDDVLGKILCAGNEDIQTNGSRSFNEINRSISQDPDTIGQGIGTSEVLSEKESADTELNTMALIGFATSLSAIGFVITGFFGLIFSIIGLIQIKQGNGEGKRMAIWGIVIGAVYTLVLLYILTIGLYVD